MFIYWLRPLFIENKKLNILTFYIKSKEQISPKSSQNKKYMQNPRKKEDDYNNILNR